MLRRLLPRQDNFFLLFEQLADLLIVTSNEFKHMLLDLSNPKKYVDTILQFEDKGDKIAFTTFESLHKTFITPFDRNDIRRLTHGLDDILDQINRCAQRFPFYELKEVPPEIRRLSELACEACAFLKEAIENLSHLKNNQKIIQHCLSIDRIESEAHTVVLEGEKNLFLHENDFKHFFKLKEIYQRIKLVINVTQDVGNIIKGIVLEYS